MFYSWWAKQKEDFLWINVLCYVNNPSFKGSRKQDMDITFPLCPQANPGGFKSGCSPTNNLTKMLKYNVLNTILSLLIVREMEKDNIWEDQTVICMKEWKQKENLGFINHLVAGETGGLHETHVLWIMLMNRNSGQLEIDHFFISFSHRCLLGLLRMLFL